MTEKIDFSKNIVLAMPASWLIEAASLLDEFLRTGTIDISSAEQLRNRLQTKLRDFGLEEILRAKIEQRKTRIA